MKIVLLASALVFASVSLSPAFADSIGTEVEKSVHLSDHTILVISEAQIARFKTVLKLTPAQEQLWTPVEAELREITRIAQHSEGAEGFVQRIRSRFRTIVLDAAALRRLGGVARPLLMSLDDEQKQKALQIVRTMGMSSLASVF
ncbi:MAG TPA: hypothetical protein VIG34_05950 [Xanthobacteraceae bacterium]|jgi:hypothetical protein